MSMLTTTLQNVFNFNNNILYDIPGIDETLAPYPMMGSPIPTLAIVFFYVYFCKKLGPQFMKNRQPYSLKTAMILYNIFQVVVNLYLFILSIYEIIRALKNGINLLCFFKNDRVNYNVDENTFLSTMEQVYYIAYLYYLVKISDFLDTVFMVLRKNFHQVSVLHLYHHATMPLATGFAIKYLPPTQNVYVAVPNMFVHIFMYSYYLASAYSPELKKNLRIKKCITLLQLSQFVFILLIVMKISMQEHCPVSMFLSYLIYIQAILMIFMFSNFYYQTYIKKNRKLE